MKKKFIRKGMKVRSVYDHDHVFTIDRSMQPDRIYHEKGSKRWWTAKELCGVTGRGVAFGSKIVKAALKSRSVAFQRVPTETVSRSKSEYRRSCLNCGTEFTTLRKETKFCKTRGASCRAEYWKRRNLPPEVSKDRLRSEKPVDTVSVVE